MLFDILIPELNGQSDVKAESIRCLLLDDDTNLLEQAKFFLERKGNGIEIKTTDSGLNALDLLDEDVYDAVISDYQMPDMDGLAFLRELRKERDDDITFIMFTGKGREEVAIEALNLGADRYLQKGGDLDIQYDVLLKAIKQEVEHKETGKKVIELNSLLKSIKNVNKLIIQEDDLKILMEKVAGELIEIRNYHNIEISLLDRKDGKIKPIASYGEYIGREWEITCEGSGDAPKCVKEVMKDFSPLIVDDPKKYCPGCEYTDERPYHNTLLFPIIHASKLTGMIRVCVKSSQKISDEEIELMEEVAGDLGLAREKIIVENELRESRDKFINLAQTTSVAIAIYKDEYWVYANPAAEKVSGYSLEELKKMKFWKLVAPEYRETVKRRGMERQEGLEVESSYEIKIITKSGKEKWVLLEASDIDYKGEKAGLISGIDITDKKKKEGELRKRRRKLQETEEKIRKLHDVAVEMESVADEEQLYEVTMRASQDILNFKVCSLDLIEHEMFEVKATIGGVQEKGIRYPVEGIAGMTYNGYKSFLIGDLDQEENARPKRRSYKSAISVPVGEFGVFQVLSEQKNDFDEKDLELVEILIHYTNQVLKRIKGEDKIKEQKKKLEELNRMSAVMDTIKSEDELYSHALKTAERILDFDMCCFSAVEGDKFVVKGVSSGISEDGSIERQIEKGGLDSKTYVNQRSYLVRDMSLAKDAKPVKGEYRSYISVPIGKYGVFEAVSTQVGKFDKDDLEAAELLIGHVTEALKRIESEERADFLHSLLMHDVGNKAQIAGGYLDMMRKHDSSEEIEEYRKKTKKAVVEALKIIEKIRDLRRIKKEEIGEVDLSSLIDEVISRLEDRLKESSIKVEKKRCSCKVDGGALLEELFYNLIENSIRHSDCSEIEISFQAEEDRCLVTVEDDGIGIS
ncbi:MAG: GAF domain-containing protein, partial [Candidatus Natronoplasma sp.]